MVDPEQPSCDCDTENQSAEDCGAEGALGDVDEPAPAGRLQTPNSVEVDPVDLGHCCMFSYLHVNAFLADTEGFNRRVGFQKPFATKIM